MSIHSGYHRKVSILSILTTKGTEDTKEYTPGLYFYDSTMLTLIYLKSIARIPGSVWPWILS